MPGLWLLKTLKHKVDQYMVLINPILAWLMSLNHIIRKQHHQPCGQVFLAVPLVEIINIILREEHMVPPNIFFPSQTPESSSSSSSSVESSNSVSTSAIESFAELPSTSAIESKSTSTSASTLSQRSYTVPDSSTIQIPKDNSAAQNDHHSVSATAKG